MSEIEEELSWERGMGFFIPINYEGDLIGLCKPEYAEEIVDSMNEQEKLRKALRFACLDLLRHLGAPKDRADDLIRKYLSLAERPKYGPRAIAVLLRERQEQLKVNGPEFIKFCDIHKVSPENLKDIYAGKSISDNLIGPISRILGRTPVEVKKILEGPGTSIEEDL